MPWTPTYTTINARAIADNLLAYIQANQVDALTWAGGSSLIPIALFANSVAARDIPVYPSIAFSDDNDATDYTGDLGQGAYSVTFEVSVQSDDPDTAVVNARKYAKAIISMIRNCPKQTLAADSGAHANGAAIETIECGFDPIRTNTEIQNDFLQVFQIRTVFILSASGY